MQLFCSCWKSFVLRTARRVVVGSVNLITGCSFVLPAWTRTVWLVQTLHARNFTFKWNTIYSNSHMLFLLLSCLIWLSLACWWLSGHSSSSSSSNRHRWWLTSGLCCQPRCWFCLELTFWTAQRTMKSWSAQRASSPRARPVMEEISWFVHVRYVLVGCDGLNLSAGFSVLDSDDRELHRKSQWSYN